VGAGGDSAGDPGEGAGVSGDDRYVLAIDLGTSALKAGLVSLHGRIAWEDRVVIDTRWEGQGAVQDAGNWWDGVCRSAQAGLASGVVRPEQVVAVALTGQWASTVPVDESGQPVGDCVMWMDQRGGVYTRRILAGRVAGYAPKSALRWVRRSGAVPSLFGDDPVGHILFLQHERPDVTKAARWFLEPVDYLSMRFTGMATASPASMTAAWLTDNRNPDRMIYDPALIRTAGVDPTKLPPLRPTGSVVGTVQDAVAADLGLPAGVKVVTGLPDLHSAAYGAGAILDYQAHMAISTTSWISAPVPFKKTDIWHSIASVPGVPPGRYLIANNVDSAGRCLEWLRDSVLGGKCEAIDYPAITSLAAGAPPGAGGVLFTPWLKGERSPVDDRHARGGFHNLSLTTTRADLARSVLEGVAHHNRWLLGLVEKHAGRRLDPIRLIGGGAESDVWVQIIADVTDHTIERVRRPVQAGVRGAALFAGVALGELGPDEVRPLVEVDRVFRPDPVNRAIYERAQAEYPRLYKAQKGMFTRVNRRPEPDRPAG
jgi:xylulokinase